MRIKKIIAIFLLIAVLLMPVAVYAETPIPDPPAGAYSYWIVVLRPNDSVYLITSPNPIIALDQGEYGIQITTQASHKTYNLIDGNWSYDKEGLGSTNWPIKHVYASNHDIAYSDGSGFFFTPPKVSALFLTAKEADFGMIWMIILDGLIPLVGLLILGISFRKGWAFLQNQLTH